MVIESINMGCMFNVPPKLTISLSQ